jgi:transposase-like protein
MASKSRTSRRRWSDTFKQHVVSEASQPGVAVTKIAHRYDLDARRISNWTTKFGSGAALVPVEVTTDDDDRFPMSADRAGQYGEEGFKVCSMIVSPALAGI